MTFADIDAIFETDKVSLGYDSLKKRYDEGERSAELLWRLCRLCHEVAYQLPKNKRKEKIFEGRGYGWEAHDMDAYNFEAVKWASILTGEATDFLGTKEKIEQGGRFKALLDTALAIDPKDFVLLHLRGRFSHTIANLTWLERKAAAVLYSEPPKATIDDALADFEAAYKLRPDWIENLVYMAKCCQSKGNKGLAKKYFTEALEINACSMSDQEMLVEARQLSAKC